ncbi:hypothetical protein MHYP_G00246730 [Metynnis hypsauchen]
MEKRLAKNPEQAAAYIDEIQRLERAGYVVKLEPGTEDTPISWYIPHDMVQHNGKHCVVFNCSFQFRGEILNQHLLPEPTLGPSILAVLLSFREHSVAISSDIRGMFHQVKLLPEGRPLLRFLWRDLNRKEPPSVYEWMVLPFGTTSSPCCATYALQKHILDHSQQGDVIREAVLKGFYVDNCLLSLMSEDAAKVLVDELRHVLVQGGFELQQCASNRPPVISHLPSEARLDSAELWIVQGQPNTQESALGLQWHCQSDMLSFKHHPFDSLETTMRTIYRVLASQYDPFGFLVPYTPRAKIVVQMLRDKKRDWDDPSLPGDLLLLWQEWKSELSASKNITLPRCYTSPEMDSPNSNRKVHVFCDASECTYGSVVYLRSESPSGKVEISFLTARSRVAPKKQQSILHLDLCTALTGAQLARVLREELTLPINNFTFWTDFTTALNWLQSDSCRFKVFVDTRVAEIQDLTEGESWCYVDSAHNPADITRGKPLAELTAQSRWGQGPPFLQMSPGGSGGQNQPTDTPPTADDYREAENVLLQRVQQDGFPAELQHLREGKPLPSSSHLLTLSPVLDSTEQLIRVGGRLRCCPSMEVETIHPVVLDPKHKITQLLIQAFDEQLHHPGAERVFAETRRQYWILRGRKTIRRHQHQCTDSKRWCGKPEVPEMADLPPARLCLHKPAFYFTGVDCFGPYTIKVGRRNEKRGG